MKRLSGKKSVVCAVVLLFAVLSGGISVAWGAGRNDTQRDMYQIYLLQQRQCATALAQIHGVLRKYAENHENAYPMYSNIAGLRELAAYGLTYEMLACPASRIKTPSRKDTRRENKQADSSEVTEEQQITKPEELKEEQSAYIYLGGYQAEPNDLASVLPMMFDKPGYRHTNVLFLDGHVMQLSKVDGGRFESCREVIDQLDAQYEYPQHLLVLLQALADNFDLAMRSSR